MGSYLLMCCVVLACVCIVGHCTEECLDDSHGCRCSKTLLPGQFYCVSPPVDIDTQSVVGCNSSGWVNVTCFSAPNVTCCGKEYSETQCVFQQTRRCRYVKSQRYNYYIAVALSLFLGMFGIDRFYLGYAALGLVKLCTLGFIFIGHLIDFLLILLQVVGPADRSGYYAPFYGPLVEEVNSTDPFLPITNDVCV